VDTGILVDMGARACTMLALYDGYALLDAAVELVHLGGARIDADDVDAFFSTDLGTVPLHEAIVRVVSNRHSK
jgi:hypothetical protein